MSKDDLIDKICEFNKTAKVEFLETFTQEELNAYLEQLREIEMEELALCS